MRQFNYQPKGVCSMQIRFMLDEDDVVHNVEFIGGCPGNTVGIATLAEGQNAQQLIAKLKGIDCRGRGTSCPDQLAKALTQALASK
ncbi:MAG: TIGR03905 family TSCPD domain-containing protein [Eubacteriales bacterium]|nr:TIGR03905 family TSCPD domain-containing protein [Eubacteriales bacterium]